MNGLTIAYPLMPVNVLEVLFCYLGIFGSLLLWPKTRSRGICLLLALMSTLMVFNIARSRVVLSVA